MEQLLHYCWKHKLWPKEGMTTTDGQTVEVIDPGLHNHNAGPDFFNAKVKIDGMMWIGNVEIHERSSDWYRHGHNTDPRYDNVVLHIVSTADSGVQTAAGHFIPQVLLQVPADVRENYEELLRTDSYPPCYKIIPQLQPLTIHAWMASLQTERLEQKTVAIEERAAKSNDSWEDAYFQTLARNYGFGINGDAFEEWVRHIPLSAVGKHRDDLFQIEAIFLGQAGLLELDAIPSQYQQQAIQEGYFTKLRNEYTYLAHKFSLQPMDRQLWRFLRLRPQNFPHIRISQLANLYYNRKASLSALVECTDMIALAELMNTQVTPYWQTHYTFGAESRQNTKSLSPSSINLLIINTCIPLLFAYGRHSGREELCDRAFDFLEQLKAEENHIIRMWKECGLDVRTAGDSQALIQLKRQYCDRRDCLRCRIGYEYLRAPRQEDKP